MPIDLGTYASLRPFLYHLTAKENLARIVRTWRVESAVALADRAGRPDIVLARRRAHVPVEIAGETVLLRDQAPLHRGNMRLDEGWSFEQLVQHINERVFFWPGGADGPIS